MQIKITPEKRYDGNINRLLLIYGFGDDFLIGNDLYTKFYVKVGDK